MNIPVCMECMGTDLKYTDDEIPLCWCNTCEKYVWPVILDSGNYNVWTT